MADMSVLDYAMMIEDSVVNTFVTEFRLPGEEEAGASDSLIAASLCDCLSDGISMVYSFFDPELPQRSLGTYMILQAIEHARSIASAKLDYKTPFKPQEILTAEGWGRA